ncbi:hypothetical protein TVAG_238130 [Trichomonas vaginalis G3]|uniref:ADF-H domain-containing protein n=1 Tax=Trichomonas vaginalis (strain ATCC PRA-98 / G3) TaxID=412133 RepID=A2DD13_TRIV3|nr:negative regulation of actin filament polymerization [Trichomonas vaginalis G3]EAY21787.1 hypothetical protein TVAG_238130 [Trichomonas vaginalis G3]KAI5522368.1 negative regulation of actin filament polymerization [Trichomonas vaginalis G3]|eukprot:XP_001582773.1 hypothetical protein [Trichomonas vaginalis G3]
MKAIGTVDIPPDTLSAIRDFEHNTTLRAIKLTIQTDKLVIAEKINSQGSPQSDFNGLTSHMNKAEPCFTLVHVPKTGGHAGNVLVIFIPMACPLRTRTAYVQSRSSIEKKLKSTITSGLDSYFIDDLKDFNYSDFEKQNTKDDAALSPEERIEKQALHDAIQESKHPEKKDAFTWKCDAQLTATLKKLATKVGPKIVAGMCEPTGNGLKLCGTGNSLKDIKTDGARYIAMHYQKPGKEGFCFILFCSDSAKPREKMMASTCKQSFISGCKSCGIEFNQQIELRELSEFNDANVERHIK